MIAKLIELIKGLLAGEGEGPAAEGGARLDPAALKRKVVEAANERAMSWDDQVDLPNIYEVRISEADWDGYFGGRRRDVELRLEAAVGQFAAEIGASLGEPSVSIVADGGLAAGEAAADAWFGDASAQATPTFSPETEPAEGGDLDTPAPEWRDPVTPARGGGQAAPAAGEPPSAALVGPGGRVFPVRDGDTVGVMRDAGREAPAVELPYTEGMAMCSQVHASFERGGAGWEVRLHGKNGLCVNGASWVVAEGAAVAVGHGDTISFGDYDGDAYMFREEAADERGRVA